MRVDILPIGDIHLEQGQSLDRIHMLGRFIVAKKPRKIIQMGDWSTWASLSPWDKGKIHIEGKRYVKDVDMMNQALGLLDVYIKQAQKEEKGYNPSLVFLEGNHEYWITRLVMDQPTLEGKISLDDVAFKYYGWKVIPFLEPYTTSGFTFKHYFTTGLMGRPISGEAPAVAMLRKTHMSCIAGHSHEFHAHEGVNGAGDKLLNMVVGCYIDPRYMGKIHFTHETPRWWSGLVMLYEAQGGYASFSKYDFDYIKRKY